jgi:membrane-bound metal-dependent hydrolase YbcI (DUF457 family)
MTWKTHLVVGTNTIWLLTLTNNTESNDIAALIPAAMIASLLPDIDAAGRGAKIHYMGGGILKGFRGVFHHRGLMHSLFVVAIIFVFLFFVNIFALGNSSPLLPYVFALSYLSHSIIDGLNCGVGYLFPFNKKKYALIPRALWTPVNGFTDNLLFMVGSFSLIIFYFLYFFANNNSII